jgi:hypothetical protein
MSSRLSLEMTELLELFIPIYCVHKLVLNFIIIILKLKTGNLLFELLLSHHSTYTFSIIGIAIGLIHSILPMQEINENLFEIKEPDFIE